MCVRGHKDTVELLIAKGAEVNGKTTKGYSAWSVAQAQGYEETVKLLRQHGAKE